MCKMLLNALLKSIAVSEKHQRHHKVFGRIREVVCGLMNHKEMLIQNGVFENLLRNIIINASLPQ